MKKSRATRSGSVLDMVPGWACHVRVACPRVRTADGVAVWDWVRRRTGR